MSIEAMKQALDALELHGKQYPFTLAAQGYCLDAITALRTAIEAAESVEPQMRRATREEKIVRPGIYEVMRDVLSATPTAAPVQEPVMADGLPKLPEPAYRERSYAGHGNESVDEYFSAHQMQEYASGARYFYKRRCDALQKWQSKMRDPERTIVCDILANGCTLEPAGDRYTTPPAAPVQEPVEKRYRFLLGLLIERGVLTNTRYSNGTWVLQGIYGVDDSGIRGAGLNPEQAIDNAIVAHGLDPATAAKFWQDTHNAIATPPAAQRQCEDDK